jgi:hypothetical protein
MSAVAVLPVALILGLMITAAVVSKRRNRRTIDAFGGDECRQLKIGLRDWMVPRAEKKLAELGWRLVGQEPGEKGYSHALFERSDNAASKPLSKVLHRLNNAGFLSAAPMTIQDARGNVGE